MNRAIAGRAAIIAACVTLLVSAGSTGCASMNSTRRGAVIGGAAGAVAGGVIGNQTGSTARGAIIGAVLGGVAGSIIGRKMDERAAQISQDVPGAIVERVGEGIQITFPSGVLFDFDSDVVRPDAATHLDNLTRHLRQYDDSNLMIAGHTDDVGGADYNQALSERRAESAARYMMAQGLERHIATAGLGEREALVSNASDAGRQKNRRIEIAIYASASLQEDARRQAATR